MCFASIHVGVEGAFTKLIHLSSHDSQQVEYIFFERNHIIYRKSCIHYNFASHLVESFSSNLDTEQVIYAFK